MQTLLVEEISPNLTHDIHMHATFVRVSSKISPPFRPLEGGRLWFVIL